MDCLIALQGWIHVFQVLDRLLQRLEIICRYSFPMLHYHMLMILVVNTILSPSLLKFCYFMFSFIWRFLVRVQMLREKLLVKQ